MDLVKYKSFRRFVKRKFPELSIQRRKCIKNWGWYADNKIVISNDIKDETFANMILTHEVAHHIAREKEIEAHNRWFGMGYYKAYKIYLEWLEWNKSDKGDNV
jgi:Cft2 family RNA processing exonuclease